MIKKRHTVATLALVSALIASLLYSNLALAQKGKETVEVEVVNLPLDEEGNLRTTAVQTSKIMLVFNQSLTLPSNVYNFIYLTSFDTNGFRYAYITAKAQGTWQITSNIHIWFYENNFGIQTEAATYISLITYAPYTPHYGTGKSGRFEIHSTEIDLYLQVYNSNVGFDGLLMIAVHLTN